MGATLQNSVPMKEILKPTGYDIPASVKDKTWGQATSGGGAVIEDDKTVSITANGTVEITPSSGNDAMAKVTASVNVPSDAKEEQTKSVTITENGTTTVTPDSGKVLSSVSITTNVSGGGGGGASFPDDIYAMWMAFVPDAFTDKTITIGANDKDIYVIRCPNNTTSTGDVSKIYSTYNFIKLTPGETEVINVSSPDSVSFTLNSENTSVAISYTGHTVGYDNRFIVIAVNR